MPLGIWRYTAGAIKDTGAVSAPYVHKLLENSITWLSFFGGLGWGEGGGRRDLLSL